jgi:hypothetical protein
MSAPTRRLAAVLAVSALALASACGSHRPTSAVAGPGVSAAPPAGATLACGPSLVCDTRTTYCEIINTDVPALPSNYACPALPARCAEQAGATKDCHCFPPGTRCPFCVPIDREGFRSFRRTCVGKY